MYGNVYPQYQNNGANSQYPQNPQHPQNSQHPQHPQYPQNPQYPQTFRQSDDNTPRRPAYPSPPQTQGWRGRTGYDTDEAPTKRQHKDPHPIQQRPYSPPPPPIDIVALVQGKYGRLHQCIQSFAQAGGLTAYHTQARMELLSAVSAAAKTVLWRYPQMKVQPFGSFVTGLSLHDSDFDVVITGIVRPEPWSGQFSPDDKRMIGSLLDKLKSELSSGKHPAGRPSRSFVIHGARVPILKMRTAAADIDADISLNDDTAVRAAEYVRNLMMQHPALRPLVMVLKGLLRWHNLNDVATGGLSSYSLTHMVAAHLQEEAKTAGVQIQGLGHLLYRFLMRYGSVFDYDQDAVSVGNGGLVPRRSLPIDLSKVRPGRLVLVDPMTGREVAGGTHKMTEVREVFHQAAEAVEEYLFGPEPAEACGNALDALFDVDAALAQPDRTPQPHVGQKRRR